MTAATIRTKPTKLIAVTPLGTFTRTTGRKYTHVVVCAGYWRARPQYGRPTEKFDTFVRWCGSLALAQKQLGSHNQWSSNADFQVETVQVFPVEARGR